MGGVLWSKIQKVLSKEIQRKQLKQGDHIYTWRPDNSKAHHGIYDGDEEKVIHLTPRQAGQEYSEPRGVLFTSIDDFLDGGRLYLFEYGVNPVLFLAKPQGGATCTPIIDTPECMKFRMSFFLQNNGFRVHHLYKNNSEDFAVYCKTGLLSIRVSRSEQAASILAISGAVFFLLLGLYFCSIFTPASLTGWAAAAVVVYCTCRLASDIGARPDVSHRVAVEELAQEKVKELGFLPTLKAWIFLVFSIWFYLVFKVPECITLFCWAIFQGNFNFRSWVLSNKISGDQLQPGDHIYAWRGYTYTHHGIYAGDRKAIHMVRGPERGRVPFMYSSSPFYSSNNHVESISISDFASGGELYRYAYGVNLGSFIAKLRGGACALASSDPPEDVLDRANFLLRYKSKNGKELKESKAIVGAYDLFKNNCEDFAIYCKTSLAVTNLVPMGRSGQIGGFYALCGFVFFLGSPYMISNLIRMVIGFCIYSTYRIISDTKYRWDTSRVPVDQLADLEKFVADISSKWKLLRLLKLVIACIIGLWCLLCLYFDFADEMDGPAATVCDTNEQLEWILMLIVFSMVFV